MTAHKQSTWEALKGKWNTCLSLSSVACVLLLLVGCEFHLSSLTSSFKPIKEVATGKRQESDSITEYQYESASVQLASSNGSVKEAVIDKHIKYDSLSLTDAEYNYTCEVSSSGVRSLTFDDNKWVAFDGASAQWQPSHASIRQLALALFGLDLNKSTQFVDGFLLKSQTALCALSTLVSAHYGARKALTVTDADGMVVRSSDGGAALSQLPKGNTLIATVNPNDIAEMRSFVKMRVFQIGFNKAATVSISQYLKEVLGEISKVLHFTRNSKPIADLMKENSDSGHKVLHRMEDAIAFTDFESVFWREIAAVQYPYALFILNFRANHLWMASNLKHFMRGKKRCERMFPVLNSEQMEMVSANMSAAEKRRFEDVFALRKSAPKKASVENRDYRELYLSLYNKFRIWRRYFYEHMCEVLNAFQNEWRKADSSLLVGDIETGDFVGPKLREFIAPYFKLKNATAKTHRHKSSKQATYVYMSLVNAFLSHWSNLYSVDYGYNECAVSECICRRVFRFDVSLPQSNRTSFKCELFSVDALERFIGEPLSSLQSDF